MEKIRLSYGGLTEMLTKGGVLSMFLMYRNMLYDVGIIILNYIENSNGELILCNIMYE